LIDEITGRAGEYRRLREEIDYVSEVWSDDPDCDGDFDAADAFHHVYDVALGNNERALIRECHRALVAVGHLYPRLPGTIIYGRDRAVIINGKRHDCDAWCDWIAR
jgi:hypothetical protein